MNPHFLLRRVLITARAGTTNIGSPATETRPARRQTSGSGSQLLGLM
jgi:hypothetical protein